MNKNYLLLTLLFMTISSSSIVNSQTALDSGDVAFVGINTRGDDFAFILLKDITASTTITFNNKGWKETGGWFSKANGQPLNDDKTVIWTADKAYAVGDIIRISGLTSFNGDGSAGTGTLTGDAIVLNFGGETMYAYQGAEPIDETNVHQFITAINTNGGFNATNGTNNASDGDVPSSLTLGTDCLEFVRERDNGVYSGGVIGSATVLRALINDNSGWTTVNGNNSSPNSYSLVLKSSGGDVGDGILSTDNAELEESLSIYPNPAVDIITVKLSNHVKLLKVDLISVSGQLLKTTKRNFLNIEELPSGLYFLNITTNIGTLVKKVLNK